MPARLFRIYQRRRIVNINTNVLLAGFIAIAIAKLPVAWVAAALGPGHKHTVILFAYVLDTLLDAVVYYALHWVANHWRPAHAFDPAPELNAPAGGRAPAPRRRNFLLDASHVQAERIALVPVFAVISMGGMWALQRYADVSASWAFVFAFVAGMLVTRVLHTVWGVRSGSYEDDHIRAKRLRIEARRSQRRASAAAAAPPEPEPEPEPLTPRR